MSWSKAASPFRWPDLIKHAGWEQASRIHSWRRPLGRSVNWDAAAEGSCVSRDASAMPMSSLEPDPKPTDQQLISAGLAIEDGPLRKTPFGPGLMRHVASRHPSLLARAELQSIVSARR
jgi:hypothetical protein